MNMMQLTKMNDKCTRIMSVKRINEQKVIIEVEGERGEKGVKDGEESSWDNGIATIWLQAQGHGLSTAGNRRGAIIPR